MSYRPDDEDQTKCLEAMELCPCLHVRRTARAVTRMFDDLLQPLGIRSTQFVILASLRANNGRQLPSLADDLGLDRSALTRALGPLESAGLVRRKTGQTRRASSATLTAKGRRIVHDAIPVWERAMKGLLKSTTRTKYRRVIGELGALTEATKSP